MHPRSQCLLPWAVHEQGGFDITEYHQFDTKKNTCKIDLKLLVFRKVFEHNWFAKINLSEAHFFFEFAKINQPKVGGGFAIVKIHEWK